MERIWILTPASDFPLQHRWPCLKPPRNRRATEELRFHRSMWWTIWFCRYNVAFLSPALETSQYTTCLPRQWPQCTRSQQKLPAPITGTLSVGTRVHTMPYQPAPAQEASLYQTAPWYAPAQYQQCVSRLKVSTTTAAYGGYIFT